MLKEAAVLDRADAQPLLLLGDLERERGNDEAALVAYRQGLARAPAGGTTARVYLACAEIQLRRGETEEAARVLETAERLAGPHPIVAVNLASVYVKLGRKKDAARAYRRFLGLSDHSDPDLERRVRLTLERLEAEGADGG